MSTSQGAGALPWWYLTFYRYSWPAWWIGTALIMGSWADVVSSSVGWFGFAVAAVAAFGSYILPTVAGVKSDDFVLLNSRLLKTKDAAYHNAMERFANGASLMYDGVAFAFRPNNETASGVAASTEDVDDVSAREIADHAKAVFRELTATSPEFASAVAGRTFRVSIMSSFEPDARELCRVVDGKLTWQR